jgi:hypothetical protein
LLYLVDDNNMLERLNEVDDDGGGGSALLNSCFVLCNMSCVDITLR